MEDQRIIYLYQRFCNRTATLAEVHDFNVYLESPDAEQYLIALLEKDYFLHEAQLKEIKSINKEKIFREIIAQPQEAEKKIKVTKLWPRIASIVAAIALITISAYFFKNKNITYSSDIPSGKQGATLTLADGRKIKLSDAGNGELAKEAGITITKTVDGQVIYEIKPSSQIQNDLKAFNTLSTAKGETYILTLPDKSQVWMNSASSLTYSATLMEKGIRKVKLEGEAYFQISKDKAHPFVVESKGQKVEVLGTHFNIKAYSDEPEIKTTLLEGSVKVSGEKVEKILSPGFEALNSGHTIQINKADTELAVAWKNNEFMFEKETIENIMKMVERWYNVEIVYSGQKNGQTYSGSVSRFDNVSSVLRILESSGKVHFKIESRRIYVSQ